MKRLFGPHYGACLERKFNYDDETIRGQMSTQDQVVVQAEMQIQTPTLDFHMYQQQEREKNSQTE